MEQSQNEIVEELIAQLGTEAKSALIDRLQGELIQGLVDQLNHRAAHDNVEVFLTGAGKAYRVESVAKNGPCIQINVDETLEPTVVMIKRRTDKPD